jgi:predicted MFS family arabinose efflux permease
MSETTAERNAPGGEPSAALLTVLAVASGALVANLYYAQPLVAAIGPEIGLSPDLAGAVVSITQIGYGVGLLLLVPLADLIENRKLALLALAVTTLGLIGTALSSGGGAFFAAAFVIGFCSSGAQVLIPFAAHMVPPERRGRVVGTVMAGLLTGIMLARPIALFISASFGWRTVFWASAVVMIGIGIALIRIMPRYQPAVRMHYGQILASMAALFRNMPALRWRAIYQALLFAAFNMFWTAAPLMLAERFGMSEHQIALFALAGAGGALVAPLAGHLADRGLGIILTAGAMTSLALSFLGSVWAATALALVVMVVFAVVIDAAIQVNQIVSQRIIFSSPAEVRGRVNGLYMTMVFAGGSGGSILGTLTYHQGGWTETAAVGCALGVVALLLLCIERWRVKRDSVFA